MPPARPTSDRMGSDLVRDERSVPPAPLSPMFVSGSVGYYGGSNSIGHQPRLTPPQQQQQQPSGYPTNVYQYPYGGEPSVGYVPPQSYSFGRPPGQSSYREPSVQSESFARYGSSHFRASPYMRPDSAHDVRPTSAQSQRSLEQT